MRLVALAAVALLGATVLAGCGGKPDPATVDSDGDGMVDAQELAGWSVVVDLLGSDHGVHRVTRHVTSDPAKADTDADGLSDLQEAILGLDPRSADTDLDGLTDCQEKLHTVRAQCEDPAFKGPYDGGTRTEGNKADSDVGYSRFVNAHGLLDDAGTLEHPKLLGDGLSDGMEWSGYDVPLPNGTLRHERTDPRSKDTDGDGLEDGEELLVYHTDPLAKDTDGDGCDDGLDPVPAAAERYAPGFMGLWWNGSQPATLRFTGVIANAPFQYPANGSLHVEAHGELDLRALPAPPMHSSQCSFPPYTPWVNVDLVADWLDAPGGARSLDLTSASNEGGQHVVFWNVQTGQLAWDQAGARAAPTGASWSGTDGRLEFSPRLVIPQGT